MVPKCLKRHRPEISSEDKLRIEMTQLRQKVAQLETVQIENVALRQKVAQLNSSLSYKTTQLQYAIKHVQNQEQDITNKQNTICNLNEIKYSLIQNKVLIEGKLEAIKESYNKLEDKCKKENEKCNEIKLELEEERFLQRSNEVMDLAKQIFLKQTLQEKDELEIDLQNKIEKVKSDKRWYKKLQEEEKELSQKENGKLQKQIFRLQSEIQQHVEVEILINNQLYNFQNQFPLPQPMDVDTPQPVLEQDVLQHPPQQLQPELIPDVEEQQLEDVPVIVPHIICQSTMNVKQKKQPRQKNEGCTKEQNKPPKNDERGTKAKVAHYT